MFSQHKFHVAILFFIIIIIVVLLLSSSSSRSRVEAYFPELPDEKVRNAVTLNFTILKPISNTGLGIVKFDWACKNPTPTVCGKAAQAHDWISLWASGSNFTYVRFVNATTAEGGSDVFKMVNLPEQSYFLRYFRGDFVVATAGPIECERHVPLETRLTMPKNDDPTQITISWTTDRFVQGKTGCIIFPSADKNKKEKIIFAEIQNVTTYTQRDFLERVRLPLDWKIQDRPLPNISQRRIWTSCHDSECFNDDTAASFYSTPGIFINVLVTDLAPGEEIEYCCGELVGSTEENKEGMMTKKRSFTPRPAAGSEKQPARIVIIGDTGTGYGTPLDPLGGSVMGGVQFQNPFTETNRAAFVFEALSEKLQRSRSLSLSSSSSYSMLVHGGDISYCRGHHTPCWQMFSYLTEPITSQISVAVVSGNHDTDYSYSSSPLTHGTDSGGEAGIVYTKRYNVQPIDVRYQVRTTGSMTLILLDTEADTQPQIEWLRETVIPNINRTLTPFVVFFLHRPVVRHFNEKTQNYFAESFADIFDEIADVVMMFHDHLYARRMPLMSAAVPNPAVCENSSSFSSSSSKNSQQCRVAFTVFPQNQLSPSALSPGNKCLLGDAFTVSNQNECRSRCAATLECSGFQLSSLPPLSPADHSSSCQLVQCDVTQSGFMNFNKTTSVSSMKRQKRQAPVYVLDGSGGQTCEQPQLPIDPRIVKSFWCQPGDENKQTFKQFGWTEIGANSSTLVLEHFFYFDPDNVVDQIILGK